MNTQLRPAIDVRAAFDQAVKLHQARRMVEAEEIYRAILDVQPEHPGALHLTGVIDIQRNNPAAAVEKIAAALRLNPGAAPFHGNFATALQALGRRDEAEKHYREAVRLDPNYAEAHCNLGQLLRNTGALDEAIRHLNRAIELRPDYADAHRGLGISLGRQNKNDAAIVALRKAIELRPDDAESYNHLGNRLKAKGELDAAESAYRKALALRPDFVDVHNNLGNVHFRRGKLADAESCYRRALELRPNYPDGYGNLGIVHMGRCRYDDAVASLRRALELRPSYPEAMCNLAQALLVLGQFKEGWERYESRWRLPAMQPRPFRQQWWHGEALLGRTILLHVEQGLGDAIQFVRYAPIVKALGADVIVEMPRELMRLFAPLARQGIRLVQRGAALPHFDLHCPLLSLPGALGCGVSEIPAAVPYLAVDEAAVKIWRERLGLGPELKIGLVWAGNPQHGNDHNRSFRPLALKPLLEVPGARFFSLQKQRRPGDDADLAILGAIRDVTASPQDFTDTAAALSALDLLIAADTSIVHLAGALARPVWMMTPFSPDWRWLLGRDDSPWYPTLRLYRQPREKDWTSVMARVAQDVAALVRQRSELQSG